MKKSIIVFMMMAVLSVGVVVYGAIFVESHVGKAVLTEETMTGDRDAADGLTVGFRADSTEELHWINSFDYSNGNTKSVFKRGEIREKTQTSIYDDIQSYKAFAGIDRLKTVKTSMYDGIRFTGWSVEPFVRKLSYDRLAELQEGEIQTFYDKIQQNVCNSGSEQKGKIRLRDYLDYYPVSFRFQFGTKRYDSSEALRGLKIYDAEGSLSPESGTPYDADVDLYVAMNHMFRIPVIENEYHEYRVSKVDDYDSETGLGYTTDVKKLSEDGNDYYEFDPIMVIQEENDRGGKNWTHRNLEDVENTLINRMLFIVNNRTAKGKMVDTSQINGGYGVYELPIDVGYVRRKIGRKSIVVPDPKPLSNQLAMVYPLDEENEYVEMSMSDDHRYLAVFSVKDGKYFVEMVDADNWISKGAIEMFPASEKMTYVWGEDGTLAVTNHKGYVAVFSKTESESKPYELIYSGELGNKFDNAFFDTQMVKKKNSYAKYQYGIDEGLSVAEEDGKVALVQNLMIENSESNIRDASLECAIIDKSGVIYRGVLKSNITDLEDGMNEGEVKDKIAEQMIQPVRSENLAEWKDKE